MFFIIYWPATLFVPLANRDTLDVCTGPPPFGMPTFGLTPAGWVGMVLKLDVGPPPFG